jgi:hypothetical protein
MTSPRHGGEHPHPDDGGHPGDGHQPDGRALADGIHVSADEAEHALAFASATAVAPGPEPHVEAGYDEHPPADHHEPCGICDECAAGAPEACDDHAHEHAQLEEVVDGHRVQVRLEHGRAALYIDERPVPIEFSRTAWSWNTHLLFETFPSPMAVGVHLVRSGFPLDLLDSHHHDHHHDASRAGGEPRRD